MDLSRYLEQRRRLVEKALALHLKATTGPSPLRRAMHHGLLGGGKRLRPILCLAAAESVGGKAAPALAFACAIEFVHAYSLIHDDLPAMDDDELRRGRPTVHIAFGEALAILAGDALLTEAFHLAARHALKRGAPSASGLKIIAELGQAAGADGMVAGQADDMQAEERRLKLAAVTAIHRRKTGALIRAAVRIGTISAGGDAQQLRALTSYAEHVGLAFQIADDILDDQASTQITGKSEGRDRERGKSTFVSAFGLDGARRQAADLRDRAVGSLSRFDRRADPLREIACYIVGRACPPVS